MSKSIRVNYLFSLINTLSAILFPLITFPYATRILEADGMGHVGFFTSIVGYISLITSLGIPVYAVREIAKYREDLPMMSRTAIEILLLHVALVILGYIMVAWMCVSVEKISIDVPLFLILSLSIFFTAIGCEWFFQGIEEFRYIAIRGLVVRIVYVILLFLLVHSKSDILIYAGLTVLGTVGNNVFNFIRLWKYVKPRFVQLKEMNISRHIIPALRIFALNIVISLYVKLDTVMIGFLKDNYSVGYYDGASKIAGLVVSLIQALQTAMIPRFSYLANNKNMKEFNDLSQKIVDFVFTISIPLAIGLCVLAPSLVQIICGHTYLPAIITLQIISPIVFLISMSGIACFQILYPLGKETLAIYSTISGASVNLILCFILIPIYAHNGAAIAVLAGESAVTITMFLYGRNYIKITYWSRHYFNCILGGVLMFITIFFVNKIAINDWANVILVSVAGAFVYGIILYLCKDKVGLYFLEFTKNKLKIL